MKPPALWALLFGLGGAAGFAVHALGAAPGSAAAAPGAAPAALSSVRGGTNPPVPMPVVAPPMAELQLPSAVPALAPRLKMREALEAAQLLERARGLLGSKPAAALELTGQHDREFPDGGLQAESDLIAAQALLALGDASAARERARTSLASHPSSAFTRQLRDIVAAK